MTTSTATSPALALAEAERERRRRTTARLDAIGLATRAGFTPDPWQVRVLTTEAPILLICCARQIGKSTAVGLLLTRYLLIPDQTIAIFSPGGRQSKELLRRPLSVRGGQCGHVRGADGLGIARRLPGIAYQGQARLHEAA